jgi:hypothetical protein
MNAEEFMVTTKPHDRGSRRLVWRRARFLGLPMIVLLTAVLAGRSIHADECIGMRGARVFASHFGLQAFKLTLDVNRASGRLFEFDSEGNEKSIWESRLVNIPVDVYVAFDGPTVVTIDTACKAGFEHSLVVYGARGTVLRDYRLEDVLTPEEIQSHVKRSISSRLWAQDARFDFDDKAKEFVITLSWGRTVRIALASGQLVVP